MASGKCTSKVPSVYFITELEMATAYKLIKIFNTFRQRAEQNYVAEMTNSGLVYSLVKHDHNCSFPSLFLKKMQVFPGLKQGLIWLRSTGFYLV